MELLLLQARIYLIFVSILLLVADIGSCKHASIFTEGLDCKSNYDTNNKNGKSVHPLQRYIAEPYFDKYDGLNDSYFQDFLAHGVPLGLCEALQDKINPAPRISILQRHLIGEGSHRRLSTSIEFDIYHESISEMPHHYCEAIIIEKLPSGVFADPFELQDLIRRGAFIEASVFGDTNLESPSIHSNRTLVEIHMDIGWEALSGSKNGLTINTELPLHARYAPLGEHGFSRIEFGQPDIFTRCSLEGKCHNQSCIFMSTDGNAKALNHSIVWEVPCGTKKHAATVSFITFISSILSALSIVVASICHSNFQTDDKKQS